MNETAWDIDRAIAQLEKRKAIYRGQTPGTSISRVLLDVSLAAKEGLDVQPSVEGKSIRVWCIGVGGMGQPKEFYYGLNIRECVERASR